MAGFRTEKRVVARREDDILHLRARRSGIPTVALMTCCRSNQEGSLTNTASGAEIMSVPRGRRVGLSPTIRTSDLRSTRMAVGLADRILVSGTRIAMGLLVAMPGRILLLGRAGRPIKGAPGGMSIPGTITSTGHASTKDLLAGGPVKPGSSRGCRLLISKVIGRSDTTF